MNSVLQRDPNPATARPRLLYLGEIPVSSTVASSALIYRLLEDYPPDRLQIWQSNLHAPPDLRTRLPGVIYKSFFQGFSRPLSMRGARHYRRAMLAVTPWIARRVVSAIRRGGWTPDMILTVAHGQGWVVADHVATLLGLPLHLLVHDDVIPTMFLPPSMLGKVHRLFGDVYRRAASRLCVSPFMAGNYLAQYGATGDVLYPSRPSNGPEYTTPPSDTGRGTKSLRFGYAGSLYIRGYADVLSVLAEILAQRGHSLTILSNVTPPDAARFKLDKSNVEFKGMLPRDQMIRFLHEKVDVLVAPMSFDAEDRTNMEVCFLSKLTDYTAAGLPLLVCGPAYGSAIRWAQENPGVAEVTTEIQNLFAAVERLENPDHRASLAIAAISAGKQFFSYAAALELFYNCLGAKRDVEGHP